MKKFDRETFNKFSSELFWKKLAGEWVDYRIKKAFDEVAEPYLEPKIEPKPTNLTALERVANFLEGQASEARESAIDYASNNPSDYAKSPKPNYWQGKEYQARTDLIFVNELIEEYSKIHKIPKIPKSTNEILDEALSRIQLGLSSADIRESFDYCRGKADTLYWALKLIENLKKENETKRN